MPTAGAGQVPESTANRGEKENTHPTRRTGSRSRNPSRRIAVSIDLKTKSGEEVFRSCQWRLNYRTAQGSVAAREISVYSSPCRGCHRAVRSWSIRS